MIDKIKGDIFDFFSKNYTEKIGKKSKYHAEIMEKISEKLGFKFGFDDDRTYSFSDEITIYTDRNGLFLEEPLLCGESDFFKKNPIKLYMMILKLSDIGNYFYAMFNEKIPNKDNQLDTINFLMEEELPQKVSQSFLKICNELEKYDFLKLDWDTLGYELPDHHNFPNLELEGTERTIQTLLFGEV